MKRAVTLPPRRPLDPAVRAHLARVRAFVFPEQVVQTEPCPVPGCGETAAPTWPRGDLRRCAPAFEPLCARHRELAQVEQLVRGANERTALAVAMASGPLHPFTLPPPPALSTAQVTQRRSAWTERMKVKPAKASAGARRPGTMPLHGRCGVCGVPGHNRRTCPQAKGARR